MRPSFGLTSSPRRWINISNALVLSLIIGSPASAQEPVPATDEPVSPTEELEVLEEDLQEAVQEVPEEPIVESEVDQEDPSATLDFSNFRLDGRLYLSFRYRSQERRSETETDGYGTINMRGGTTDESGHENMRFHINGYASMDFNGRETSSESFYSLADTRSSSFRPFLYSAWIETDTIVKGAKLRLGRQEIHRENALYFDGARADFGDGAWQAVAYAGKPVRFYESSRQGDFLGGVGLRWWAQPTLRIGLDQVYLRDEGPISDPTVTVNDQLTILSGRWRQSANATVVGSSSWISGRPRRAQLRVMMQEPTSDMWSRFEIHHQNDYGDVVATDISPFTATLGEVQPYWSAAAEVGKTVASGLDFAVGFRGRWLDDPESESIFSREYQRWYGTLTSRDLFDSDWTAGLRADIWDSSGPSVIAAGAFASHESRPGQVLEFGTDYSKYRYDAFTGREYLDDRQVYARFKYPLREDLSLRLRLARDGSQYGVDYLVQVSFGWEF
jgi:hypothetical protein